MPLSDEAMAEVFGQAIAEHTAPLVKRIEALERRVAEAETRGIAFAGTWQKATASYRRGEVVVHDSSVWVACRDTEGERPGTGDKWQLMLKSADRREKSFAAVA